MGIRRCTDGMVAMVVVVGVVAKEVMHVRYLGSGSRLVCFAYMNEAVRMSCGKEAVHIEASGNVEHLCSIEEVK